MTAPRADLSASAESVRNLAKELRALATADPDMPVAVRAAAGWLRDLVRERDEARAALADALSGLAITAEVEPKLRAEIAVLRRERDDLRREVHDLLNPTSNGQFPIRGEYVIHGVDPTPP